MNSNSMRHENPAINGVELVQMGKISMSKSNQPPNNELQALLNYPGLTVINCWANWCVECHMISPLIDQLDEEYKDSIKLVRIDIDESTEIASSLGLIGINSVPVTFIFKSGELVEKIMGIAPYEAFRSAINKHLA